MVITLNKKNINLRIARRALELQNYDYSKEHRPDKRMSHVDALSRVSSILIIEDNTFEFNLSVCQSQDQKIKEIKVRIRERIGQLVRNAKRDNISKKNIKFCFMYLLQWNKIFCTSIIMTTNMLVSTRLLRYYAKIIGSPI